MNAPTIGQAEGTTLLVAGAIALVAVVYVIRKAPAVAKGALTGDNALTRSATNADGSAQTAYVGAGPAGTLGAATNAAFGGWLSSFGDWIGTKLGDATIADPNAQANADLAAQRQAQANVQAMPFDYGSEATNPYGW